MGLKDGGWSLVSEKEIEGNRDLCSSEDDIFKLRYFICISPYPVYYPVKHEVQVRNSVRYVETGMSKNLRTNKAKIWWMAAGDRE